MADQNRTQQNESPRLAIRIEYVGVIAVMCLFVGVIVGGYILMWASPSGKSQRVPAAASQTAPEGNTMQMLAQVQSETNYDKLVSMGNEAYDSGQAALAIHAYEKALKIQPGSPDVMTDLGSMYLQINQPERAIALSRKAASLAPTHPQCRFLLGQALLQTGDKKGAKEAFEQAIKVAPSGEVAKHARAELDKLGK